MEKAILQACPGGGW